MKHISSSYEPRLLYRLLPDSGHKLNLTRQYTYLPT